MIKALKFKPGINREVTPYSNEGGFFDGDKIRFRMGFPEKIGGWEKYSANQYLGSARRLHNWIGLDSSNFLGIGTHLKYYIEEGTTFNDITPIRQTTSAGDVTFSASNGSATITVTDTSHGAVENDFVTFSGAVSLGGVITATVLNKEYQIVNILDANTYTITSAVAANSSDTGNGGSSVVGTYQVNVGLDQVIGGTGFGAGTWGGVTNGALQTTINEGGTFSNSDTTLTVTSGTGISNNDFILIDSEILQVTNVATNDLTVTRGQSGTDASTHANGATVFLIVGNANSDNDYVGWGDAATVSVTTQIRLWSHDNFGEDLIINIKDGGLFYWDKSLGLSVEVLN